MDRGPSPQGWGLLHPRNQDRCVEELEAAASSDGTKITL